MTLESILLRKIAEARTGRAGQGRLSLDDPNHRGTVVLDLELCDTLGCRLREIQIVRREPLADLAAAARRYADRVTGLLETLTVHEIDTGRQVALLRSDAPAARGEAVAYYEITLTPSELKLCRWEGSRNASGRKQVSFALTNEALFKLVEDLLN
jgi:hypothetical protein